MIRSGAIRLLTDTVQVNGTQVTPTGSYRVTVNDFLAEGAMDSRRSPGDPHSTGAVVYGPEPYLLHGLLL
jgi:hypothetical protein